MQSACARYAYVNNPCLWNVYPPRSERTIHGWDGKQQTAELIDDMAVLFWTELITFASRGL